MISRMRLYRGVPVTRTYSLVHDLDRSAWVEYLEDHCGPLTEVPAEVAYNRLPETLVVKGKYEDLRKASYGYIVIGTRSEEPLFFWVDKANMVSEGSGGWDAVALTVSEDVWTNNMGRFHVTDSYVVRRHMPRWDGAEPIYYPNAAQGVTGIYETENISDIVPTSVIPSIEEGGRRAMVELEWIVAVGVDTNGRMRARIGCDSQWVGGNHPPIPIRVRYHYDGGAGDRKLCGRAEFLDGKMYGELAAPPGWMSQDAYTSKMNANDIQNVFSVTVFPFIEGRLRYEEHESSPDILVLDVSEDVKTRFLPMVPFAEHYKDDHCVLELTFDTSGTDVMTQAHSQAIDIGPKPVRTGGDDYDIKNEPMMFISPARPRKIVSGAGAEILSIPDTDGLEDTWDVINSLEQSNGMALVFPHREGEVQDVIREANGNGTLAVVPYASLPCVQSSWKLYEATAKGADDMAYMTRTLIDGLMAAAGVAVAMVPGGPLAMAGIKAASTMGRVARVGGGIAALGGAGGLVKSGAEHAAAQTKIRNSPAAVSTGMGLGSVALRLTGIYHMTLKLDPSAFAELESQYYYYGYFIRRVERGVMRFRTRRLFDFIQTEGAHVTGNLNGEDAARIADILDAGVTIWHDLTKLGTGMQYENRELEGGT